MKECSKLIYTYTLKTNSPLVKRFFFEQMWSWCICRIHQYKLLKLMNKKIKSKKKQIKQIKNQIKLYFVR